VPKSYLTDEELLGWAFAYCWCQACSTVFNKLLNLDFSLLLLQSWLFCGPLRQHVIVSPGLSGIGFKMFCPRCI